VVPELPVPLFSYLLFELKQALDCFEHCKLLGGQLVYYPKVLQGHTVQDLSLLIWAVVVLIFVGRPKLPVPLFSYLLFELTSPRLFRAL
jgi:hypothetical protein